MPVPSSIFLPLLLSTILILSSVLSVVSLLGNYKASNAHLLGPASLCPQHLNNTTNTHYSFNLFNHCATNVDLYFFLAILCGIIGIALGIWARMKLWRWYHKGGRTTTRDEEDQGRIEFSDWTATERMRVPDPVHRSGNHPMTSFLGTAAPVADLPPTYSSLRRAPTWNGGNRDWVPGRVSCEEPHNVNDWRGKWNKRMSRLG
ncbi:MAG: hypothetical protein Q9219_006402 [cf. Caloplaca sp. 3 TL-2023]